MASALLRLAEPAWRAARSARSAAGRAHRRARRLRRALRVRLGEARMLAALPAAGLTRTPVFLLLPDLHALTPELLRALRLAVRARAPVHVVVLDVAAAFDRAVGPIPERVRVHRYWLDAAPGGGGALPRHRVEGLEQAPLPGKDDGWLRGYYRDGSPVLAITEQAGWTIVEHLAPGGQCVRRDEIDPDGRLIRLVDLHPTTAEPVGHRYLAADGRCWLSVRLDPDSGEPGPADRHAVELRAFDGMRDCQAEWVAGLLAAGRSRVVVTGPVAQHVADLARTR